MRLKKVVIAAVVLALAGGLSSCARRSGSPGSKENPIRFFFMPLKGEAAFQQNAPIIQKFIEETTGLSVKPVSAPDFVTITKAFGNNMADVAFMNTLGYLMARDWAKAEAHLLALYGDVYRTYRGEIVARADGPVGAPSDLTGKTVALSDPFSASGYLYALKFFRDHGIQPAKTLFASGHRKAVEMVYEGKADAAATYHTQPGSGGQERDARAEIAADHPDVFAKVRIVALTDEIPNGPVALRHTLPADIKAKIVGALIEFARTPEGRATLMNLYNMTGLTLASDADYDGVQRVLRELGKTVGEVVPGGVTFYQTQIDPLLGN